MERAGKISPMRQSRSAGQSSLVWALFVFFEFNFDVPIALLAVVTAVTAVTSVDRIPVPSATELAVVSSKAALASAGMDPGLIDATFVGNVIQSRSGTCY